MEISVQCRMIPRSYIWKILCYRVFATFFTVVILRAFNMIQVYCSLSEGDKTIRVSILFDHEVLYHKISQITAIIAENLT